MNDAVIGLDAVTMVVSGKCPKQIEQRIEKRNKQGRLYLEVDKTKQNETYNVTIVLPSIIGTDIKTVQAILGHANIQTTLNTYTHALEEKKREASNALDVLLNKQA